MTLITATHTPVARTSHVGHLGATPGHQLPTVEWETQKWVDSCTHRNHVSSQNFYTKNWGASFPHTTLHIPEMTPTWFE